MSSSRDLLHAILAAARRDWIRRWRDPLSLALWLGIPLVIGGLIVLAMGGRAGSQPKARVLVVLHDDGLLGELLVKALSSEQAGVIEAETVDEELGRSLIERGEASALLVVPQGFSNAVWNEWPIALELVTNPSQRILPGIVMESLSLLSEAVFYAHRVLGADVRAVLDASVGRDELEIARAAVGVSRGLERVSGYVFPPAIELRTQVREAEGAAPAAKRSPAAYFLPAMLMMALLFMAEGLADDVWREKHSGALRRILSSPTGASASLVGKGLAGWALMGSVALVVCALGAAAFDLAVWRALLAALWCSCAGAVFLALLTLLKLFASSQRGAGVIGNLLLFPLLMLGGSFVPFVMMPQWLVEIGRRLPNGAAVELLDTILFGAPRASTVALGFAAAFASCALLVALASRRFSGAFARGES